MSETRETIVAVREQDEPYRAIFESTIDGLAIVDLEGTIVEANTALCQMLGYTRAELIGRSATMLTPPDRLPALADALRRVVALGDIPPNAADKALRKDGSLLDVETRGRGFTYKGRPHLLAVARDITEQVKARELLEQRVTERTREISTLLDITHNVTSTLELRPLLDLILEQLKTVAEYAGAGIVQLAGDELRVIGYRGPIPQAIALQTTFPAHSLPVWAYLTRGEPVIIQDVRGDDPLARAYRQAVGEHLETLYAYVRCFLAVPMMLKGQVIGALTLEHNQPGYYAQQHLALATAIAQQAAIAIENARLYEQTVQRTNELSALLDVSRTVTSTLELKPLLNLILDQVKLVADNDGMTLLEVRGDELVVLLRRTTGPQDQELEFPRSYTTQSHGPLWERLRRGEVVIIGDVRGDDLLAQAYRQTVGDFLTTSLSFERAFMAVPLMLKDRIIGHLGLSSARPDYYTAHHGEVALAIAQQAAIAIENARLYRRAQEVAVLEERQRLSRELHDSVSQALYSIALGTKTARALLEPGSRAVEPVEFALAQAERGLAEMRALIFALRPEALEQDGLVAALQRQVDAQRARQQRECALTTALCAEPEAPLAVKEALYRIAQEALHNSAKHGHAQSVEVRLEEGAGGLVLEVRDDGAGFDPAGAFPGHLGLHTMRERAARLGGTLEVVSAPGAGTRVRAQIPLPARRGAVD